MIPENITDLGIALASDIHLDHAEAASMVEFFVQTARLQEKGLTCVVTGDITVYPKMGAHLPLLEQAGIKFVLGNHDIWGATFEEARDRAARLAPTGYLPSLASICVRPGIYLVGVDGYFDMRAGRLDTKRFETWDLTYNKSVATDLLGTMHLTELACRAWCKRDADTLVKKVKALPDDAHTVIVATHVPPFIETAKYRGEPSEPFALPFYTNITLGETLIDLAAEYPNKDFVVLAGHTHDEASEMIAPNLMCKVTPATYRHPKYSVWL